MVAGSSVAVVRVEDQHAAVLAEFYRAVWDPAATPESVRRSRAAAAARNPIAPGEAIPTFLLLQAGRALGHVTTIPLRLWAAGVERPGYWIKGLMVVPEHRNGPVGMLLLKEAVRQLGTLVTTAMVVQQAPRRLFQALGYRDLGALPDAIRLLRPGRVLSQIDAGALPLPGSTTALRPAVRLAQRTGLARLAGGLAGLALGGWAGVAGGVAARLRVAVEPELDVAAADALWRRVRTALPAAPCRDGPMLSWRYGGPGGPYRVVSVRAGRELVGIAVVRVPREDSDPRLSGLRVATLSDLLYAPGDHGAGLAAVAGAEAAARTLDADALLCSGSHRALRAILRRRAFLGVGATVHFMIREPDPALAGPADLGEWWLTRGDSSADEVF